MKRCPECGRQYNDDSMSFCLDDGAELLFGPASGAEPSLSVGDEPQTAILHDTSGSEAATRAQIFTTDQTAVFPSGIAEIPGPKNFDKRLLLAPLALAVVFLGGFFGYRYVTQAKQIESIAVMPFVNESGNADVEYLSDGMTETLISSLSNIPNLSVKARSTVFYYKGKDTSPKKIGEELKVQAVLLGRVSQRGDDLQLSLELVNTETQDVIWSEQYNRKQSDLVSLQSEIARDVSNKLKSRLSKAVVADVEKNYTTNPEAYQLYLQGRFHWNKRDKTAFEKAIVFFKQAIENDPKYALAYTGLADTYALFGDWADGRPKEYMPQAKQAALRALELDPNLPEAHASLGLILIYYDYDWTGSEQEFKRAIELNPKYPSAHQWYSKLLFSAGRQDEGLREITKAAELDPLSKIIIWNLGDGYLYGGRYDDAIKQYQKVIELFSDQQYIHTSLGDAYAVQGKYAQAIEEYLNDYRIAKEIKPEEIQKLKESYDKGGWEGFGQTIREVELSRLIAKQTKDPSVYVKPIEFAYAFCWGKDKDKVIEYLNRMYDDRSADILSLKTDSRFEFMRDDLRFKQIVKKVGIPE